MPSIPRLFLLTPTLVLAALIIWAARAGDFGAAGAWLTGEAWGIVTLADLYFGFVLSALVIAATERRWLPALFWILPVFVLGNIWTGLWFALRWPELVRRLRPSAAGSPGQHCTGSVSEITVPPLGSPYKPPQADPN